MSRGSRKGYLKTVLRMLSERGCVSYDELVEAGVPRVIVTVYAMRLHRDGIAVRGRGLDGRSVLCLRLFAGSQPSWRNVPGAVWDYDPF